MVLAVSSSPSIRRYYIDDYCLRHAEVLRGRLVLDIGGVTHGRRGKFDPATYARRLVVVNLVRERATVQGSALALPLREASVEAVVCTEVLEHLPDPRGALREISRVLAVRGSLLFSVPFLHPIHPDPRDYGRYTPEFWGEAVAGAGLELVDLESQGGIRSVIVDLFRIATYDFARGRKLRDRVLRGAFAAGLNAASRWAVRRDEKSDTITTGFGLLARKHH